MHQAAVPSRKRRTSLRLICGSTGTPTAIEQGHRAPSPKGCCTGGQRCRRGSSPPPQTSQACRSTASGAQSGSAGSAVHSNNSIAMSVSVWTYRARSVPSVPARGGRIDGLCSLLYLCVVADASLPTVTVDVALVLILAVLAVPQSVALAVALHGHRVEVRFESS